jgi:hypothetical protein
LLLLLARSTESELAKQVEYFKAENLILRRRIKYRFYLLAEAENSGRRASATFHFLERKADFAPQ